MCFVCLCLGEWLSCGPLCQYVWVDKHAFTGNAPSALLTLFIIILYGSFTFQNPSIDGDSESTPLLQGRRENDLFPKAQVHRKEEPELPTKDHEVNIYICMCELYIYNQ